MNKAFELWQWENEPSAETPLSAEFLNRLNNGLNEIDNRVINQNTTKLDVTTANTMVKDVTFDSASGIFTITKLNGSTVKIDTKLEKLAVNFEYDSSAQVLKIILEDGTTQTVDLSTLITQYEFGESEEIVLTVKNGKVVADIKYGSITADMLEPNYLANVTAQADNARVSAETATAQADRATTEADRAENAADRAEAIAGGDFATNAKVDAIIDGTTTVGNADKLDGHNSEYFAEKYIELSTSILEYAKTCANGITQVSFLSSSYNGNDLPNNDYRYGTATIYKRSNYNVMVIIWGVKNDKTPQFNYYNGTEWLGWNVFATTSDLANYLPLNGTAEFVKAKNGFSFNLKGLTNHKQMWFNYTNADTEADDTTNPIEQYWFADKAKGSKNGLIKLDMTKGTGQREILHTGNKPSGTYTGNGSATRRTIEIGGIGTVVHIGNQLNFAIVSSNGYIGRLNNQIVTGTDVYTSATGIVMETTSALFNTSGLTYTYQKL